MNAIEKIRKKYDGIREKYSNDYCISDVKILLAEIDRLTAELTDLKAEQKKDFEEAIAIIHDQGAENIILKEDNVILTVEIETWKDIAGKSGDRNNALKAEIETLIKEGQETICIANHNTEIQHQQITTLTAERDGFRNGQAQLQSICDGLMDTNAEYAAERLRLLEENRRLKEELTAMARNTVPI